MKAISYSAIVLCLTAAALFVAGTPSRAMPTPQPDTPCSAAGLPADYLIYHALATGGIATMAPHQGTSACSTYKGARS